MESFTLSGCYYSNPYIYCVVIKMSVFDLIFLAMERERERGGEGGGGREGESLLCMDFMVLAKR